MKKAWGLCLGVWVCLTAKGILAEDSSSALPLIDDARFGTYAAGGLGLYAPIDVWKADIERAKKLNMGIVRGNTDTWDLLEPKRGSYTWDRLDAVVSALNEAHIDFLFTVPISSRWNRPAGSGAQGKKVSETHYCTEDLESVRTFCKTLSARYKGKITYYEVWNEMDFDVFWEGKSDPKAYLAFIQAAYAGLKEGNPDCVVLMGGLAKPSNPEWFEQFLALGGGAYFDRANIHVYPAFGTLTSALQTVRGSLQKHGLQKPIWITETSNTGMYFDTSDRKREEDQKAIHLAKNYAQALSQPDIERVFWHSLRNPGTDIHIRELDFGLMNNKGEPMPAFWAYQFMRDELLHSQPVGKLPWDGLEAYAFDKKDKRVVIVWSTGGPAHVPSVPGFSRARVITIYGKPRDISMNEVVSMTLTQNPVYLEFIR